MRRCGKMFSRRIKVLVLSRKVNESIVIDGGIVVTVREIRGDKVRIGIVAPKEIPVNRKEVHDAIKMNTGTKEILKSLPVIS